MGLRMPTGKLIQTQKLTGSIPSSKLLNHDFLNNRDSDDTHTINAIDGLDEQLDSLSQEDTKLYGKIYDMYGSLSNALGDERLRAEQKEVLLQATLDILREENIKAHKELLADAKERISDVQKQLTKIITDSNEELSKIFTDKTAALLKNIEEVSKRLTSAEVSLKAAYKNADADNLAIAKEYTNSELLVLQDAVTADLEACDALLRSYINTEVTRIGTELTSLHTKVDDNQTGILKELSELICDIDDKIKTLTESIATNEKTASDAIIALKKEANAEIARLDSEIDSNQASISSTSEELETLSSHIKDEIYRLDEELSTRWTKPTNLIFESEKNAQDYIQNAEAQVYPGQILVVNNKGLLTTYVVLLNADNNLSLQKLATSGSGGSSDNVTDPQYCVQIDAEYLPDDVTLAYFSEAEPSIKLTVPSPTRKNNTITTKDLQETGGYVYYVSKLNNLKFTSGGFDAGFTKLATNIDGYFVYRSNQKLLYVVTISIT